MSLKSSGYYAKLQVYKKKIINNVGRPETVKTGCRYGYQFNKSKSRQG